ncbi:hypothetical protein CCM_02588 [Cordyceps militaris CM01]|uniref:Uncharacterized protein n=1 Tax=Cordyceps militaris (strain CM01) TaxID=983644 RepID=G3JAK1_CORMM|nr:uncharacterized protein CCM_02588 [Cordyceps militaris CM01]EGX94317.1 hypothetical protein CCM_02588 [Cordyceps militaris CM01]
MNFDARFRDDSDETIYLHHIDEQAGSLRVQVLGQGLTQTFLHDYSKENRGNKYGLVKKTTGFLAAVSAGHKRVILAWAESGHGLGCHGDSLVARGDVLGNARWTSKALALAEILQISLATPFGKPTPHGQRSKTFQASHVEVKLATFAATLLLQLRTQAGGHAAEDGLLSRDNLIELRSSRWSGGGGGALHFEVHVSRKRCSRCSAFVTRLQELTGVRLDIRWGTRVVPIAYHQQQLKAAEKKSLARAGEGARSEPRPTTALQTYEKDGVIHYIPPDERSGKLAQQARVSALARFSLHHLSNVDKPLPATPVIEAPDFADLSDTEHVDTEATSAQSCDSFPFPMVGLE